MKFVVTSRRKLISLVKICFDPVGPKGVQNEVFHVLWKIDAFNFSDFLLEITAAYRLKIDSIDVLGKIIFCIFSVKKYPKWAQNKFFEVLWKI